MAAPKGHKYTLKWTQEKREKLIEDLLDFAENARSAHFASWARKLGYTHSWINRMAEDYPDFAQAYEDAKALMAAKLVTSSIYCDDPNFNGTHAMNYQGVYNKEWREYLRFKAEIAKEQVSKEDNKCLFNEWKEETLKK